MSDANQQNDETTTEENKSNESENTNAKNNEPTRSGDPGRTPGSAEGDRETVEQDLEEKDLGDDEDEKKSENA